MLSHRVLRLARPHLGLSLASLLIASTVCAAGDTDTVEIPDVMVGDRWAYTVIELGTREPQYAFQIEVTFRTREAIVGLINKGDEHPVDATWSSSWNPIVSRSGNVFTPVQELLRFPMHVGMRYSVSWTTEIHSVNPGGVSIGAARLRDERDVTVVGWEDVVVPAGKF